MTNAQRGGQGRGSDAWKQHQPLNRTPVPLSTSKHREEGAMSIWNSTGEDAGSSLAWGDSDLCKKYGEQMVWLGQTDGGPGSVF